MKYKIVEHDDIAGEQRTIASGLTRLQAEQLMLDHVWSKSEEGIWHAVHPDITAEDAYEEPY
jgi:hypothetical protein